MKRTIVSALVATSLLAAVVKPAVATEVGYNRKFGLGVMIGDPTGLSAKLWIAPTNALDFGLGFWGYGVNNRCVNNDCGRYGYNNGTFHMDYLWQSNIVRGQAQLDWHIGVGGRTVWWGGCNNNCFELSARAGGGPRPHVPEPRLHRGFLRARPRPHRRPGDLSANRRRPRRPLLLLDRGTSRASLALVPRAPGSLRAGKAT